MKSQRQVPLTFDQLSELYNMSVADINISINNTYNKMVTKLVVQEKFDMWDVIVELKNYFNMTEKEAVDKLNKKNKELLKQSALNRTNKQ
jgi:hypothetical protein